MQQSEEYELPRGEHSVAHGDAGLQISRPQWLENRHWACRTPPTKDFERSKSAWLDDEETVRVGLVGCVLGLQIACLEVK